MIRKQLFLYTAFVFLLLQACANARIYIVTDTNDTTKVTSLRGAIIAANRKGGRNTIILGQTRDFWDHARHWIYPLTISGSDESNAFTGDLNINRGDLTIMGMSPEVTIDATGLGDRIFNISSNAALALENLRITGGTAPNADAHSGLIRSPLQPAENGGAVYNAGYLTLIDCILTNNSSGAGAGLSGYYYEGADGGAIYNSGTFSASDCLIVGNIAGSGSYGSPGGNGGAIRNDGSCRLTRCSISQNHGGASGGEFGLSVGAGGDGGNGGGILNLGTVILNQCLIDSNVAGSGADGALSFVFNIFGEPGGSGGDGGGIYNTGRLEI
ncbi:MAG TPA: hypothetical protein VGJ73_23870, partial [Verrucomicrobiae bacterium]